MHRSITLLLVVLLSGCANSTTNRLRGTWKSNKELTVPTIHYKKAPPQKLQKKLRDIFGKLELTYTNNKITAFGPSFGAEGEAWHYETPYKVLGQDSDSMAILSKNPLTDKFEITQIHFDGKDRYWIYIYGTGWKEYFDRIHKTEQGAAANP